MWWSLWTCKPLKTSGRNPVSLPWHPPQCAVATPGQWPSQRRALRNIGFLHPVPRSPLHCLFVAVVFGTGKYKVSQNLESTGVLQRWPEGVCQQIRVLKDAQFYEFSPEIKTCVMRFNTWDPLTTESNIYSFRPWKHDEEMPPVVVCLLVRGSYYQKIILNPEVNPKLSNELSSPDREASSPPLARMANFHIVFITKVT